jgi:hypothetical protein
MGGRFAAFKASACGCLLKPKLEVPTSIDRLSQDILGGIMKLKVFKAFAATWAFLLLRDLRPGHAP